MWRILKIAVIICVFCEMHGLGNTLKVSLEMFNLTYVNKEFLELNATAVAAGNNIKKIRSNGVFKYEVMDNLQMHVDVYRITKTNKQYLIFRGKRDVRVAIHRAETIPATSNFRSHCIPDFYWPIKPNVMYTLRDWWVRHSECPFDVATGSYNGIATTKYPNNTILNIFSLVVKVFNSAENFD